jgi:pilus assembly protein CpaF
MTALETPLATLPDESRFYQLKAELHERLVGRMDLSLVRSLDPEILRDELRRGAEAICTKHAGLLTQAERQRLVDELLYETLGMGPLEPLMRDHTVSDILINGPHSVYVERRGRLEKTTVGFKDIEHLLSMLQRILSHAGRRLDESSPLVDARLPDGSRINAVIRPLALEGALVSIRRFGKHPMTGAALVSRKSATVEMIQFLAACVKARLNIMVSGGTGSGKTTLLNALSAYIPEHERIITIEDASELQLQQAHVGRMETRPPNVEGKGEVTTRDLLRNALRMRPDRILVGECRGKEAFDMLQAMTTGHDGTLSTIHANDARDAISRLEMLVGMAAPELPLSFIHTQIASALHIVVQTARLSGGQRKIVQVSEVTGRSGDAVSMHNLFAFEQEGIDEDGHATGIFRATGIRPVHLERIQRSGVSLPRDMFAGGTRAFGLFDSQLANV